MRQGSRRNLRTSAEAVYDHYRPAGFERFFAAQSDRRDRSSGGQTGHAGRLLRRRACADRFERSVRSAARCSRRRADHSSTGSCDCLSRKPLSQAVKVLHENKTHLQMAADDRERAWRISWSIARGSSCSRGTAWLQDEINAALAAGSDDLVDAAERIRAVRDNSQDAELRAAGGLVQAHSQDSGEGGSAGEVAACRR